MFKEIAEDLKPRRLLNIVTIGGVIAAIYLPQVISLSVLIYAGDLAGFTALGIGIGLFGGILTQLIVTFTSSAAGTIGGPQDSPTAILSIVAASMSAAMIGASQEARFATVLVTVALTTFFTGLLFLLVERFNLSRFIRFIPYPVIGGFIAGTGWLIVVGGFGITAESTAWDSLFSSSNLIRWLPGVVLGLTLFIASRRTQHYLVTPGILGFSILLFFVITFVSGINTDQLFEMGWLLGPFPAGALWKPVNASLLAQVHWPVILSQVSNLFAAAMISIVALLLNVSALELVAEKDLEPRRELAVMGASNLVSSLVGSPVSYHYFGLSALAFKMKAGSRLVGLVVVIILFIILFFGAALLGLIPTFMIGGLLIYLGLSFLVEWVYDAWFRLPALDYLLVLAILVVVASVGFLAGVGVGILGAIVLFAVNYGRIDVVDDVLSTSNFRSNVDRPIEHVQKLQEAGAQVQILRLQGFVFFGTAQGLLARIRDRINDRAKEKLRYLILDFQRVSSLDSSAVVSIVRIHQLTRANDIHLVFTEVSDDIVKRLKHGGLAEERGNLFHYFPTLDYGTEWCETRIITEDASSAIIRAATLQGQLKKIFGEERIERFMKYLVREEVDAWHTIFRHGDGADSLLFIESGQLAAHLDLGKRFIRLRSMGPGTAVGEVGMYLDQPRTATVTATEASVIHHLYRDSLKEMEEKDPEVAARLHRWLAATLSQRLASNSQTLEVLLN